MRTNLGRSRAPLFDEPEPEPEPDELNPRALERSLNIGAKTLAGVAIGVVTVLLGVATAGIALEAVLVPSLLLKLAGGIAGGSLGLAKGIGDERRHERGPRE
jgi:hypothetical protein